MKEYLDKLSQAYYEGKPLVSDEEFDHLAELHSYQAVGYRQGEAPHLFRMYSLQKVHFGEDPPFEGDIVTTPKLDGAAISVTYLIDHFGNPTLWQARTRGDGRIGKDLGYKINHLLPLTLPTLDQPAIQFNCEVVAPKHIENSRNYAAGALNLKDPKEVQKREITVVCYDVQGIDFETYQDKLQFIYKMGFNPISCTGLSDIYPTDGKVVRLNDEARFKEMGFTSKHPKGAYALKPRPEVVLTKLLDVEWNTGRTGVVTPTAILEPCTIGDATIQRATLHNIEYIEQLNLEIGCTVEVIRSGEIVPRVVRRVQ